MDPNSVDRAMTEARFNLPLKKAIKERIDQNDRITVNPTLIMKGYEPTPSTYGQHRDKKTRIISGRRVRIVDDEDLEEDNEGEMEDEEEETEEGKKINLADKGKYKHLIKQQEEQLGMLEQRRIQLEGNQLRLEQQLSQVKQKRDKLYAEQPELARMDMFKGEDFTYCDFCGIVNKSWKKENLQKHMEDDCPVLFRCHSCKGIVPISELTEHLTNQCRYRNLYIACDVCHLCYLRNDMDRHKSTKLCRPPADNPDMARCPLCLKDIENTDSSWLKHLCMPPYCLYNPRTMAKAKAYLMSKK